MVTGFQNPSLGGFAAWRLSSSPRPWLLCAAGLVTGCGAAVRSGAGDGGGNDAAVDSTLEADSSVDGSTADAIEDAAAEARPDDVAETGAEDGPCGPGTCSGCCDDAGRCHAGQSLAICGINGGTCADCSGLDAANCSLGGWPSCCRKAFGSVPPGTCGCIVPRYCFNADD